MNQTVEVFPNENEVMYQPNDTPNAIRIKSMVQVWEKHAQGIQRSMDKSSFPFVFSADHASAGATIAGIKMSTNARMGVVWIDAHADLHSPYTSPSGNIHGMPLAASIADDNRECARNAPSDETRDAWEKLKFTGGVSPKINPSDIVFVGVRDTEPEEEALMARHNITNHTVDQVRSKGMSAILSNIEEQLSECDLIYVSFDVDSMDPDMVSYGTGTPVPHGLSPDEASELINGLLRLEKTRAFEIVEVNPLLDNKTNKMAETSLSIVDSALAELKKRGV